MTNIEKYRRKDGIIDLNNIKLNIINDNMFNYEGKKYYIKWAVKYQLLNELVAYEIAKDFGIPAVKYYYGVYDHDDYFKGDCVISECAYNVADKRYNINALVGEDLNLEDMWYALEAKYHDENIVASLLNELVNVFLFDTLIGNDDRHASNFYIIENEKGVHVSPLFDHGYILSDNSVEYQYYTIKPEEGNPYYKFITGSLDKFLELSDKKYIELLESKLWIISKENIIKIFNRIEETGLKLDDFYKEVILGGFEENYNMIKTSISKHKPKGKQI